ncbi:uncharacterized protein LOC143152966 [Ptiloglossa arizonensis]|uniref:uncharacterized protein LOC143152966 n=1 Tax=Ptiloglossa arizonensis TaxID=3350558 RepID=UPI003F9EC1B5
MDSLERLMSAGSHQPALTATTRSQNAFVQANLCSVIGRKGRHLTGTFCLTGDTMEGIIQCLVFLKAFSVRINERGRRARQMRSARHECGETPPKRVTKARLTLCKRT